MSAGLMFWSYSLLPGRWAPIPTNCLRRLQGQSVGPEHEFPGAEALIHAGSWRNCAFKSSKSTGLVMNSAAPYWVARLRRSSSP